MLIDRPTIYGIPGWGFYSAIFKELQLDDCSIVGFDYYHSPVLSLDSIAKQMANNILNPAVVLGWSFGGLIAIKLAALFPHKVKKLILLSSQPKFLSAPSWEGIAPDSAAQFIDELSNDFEKQVSYFISLVCYPDSKHSYKKILMEHFIYEKESLLRSLDILFQEDLREDYKNLTSDILHIVNKQDAVIKQNSQQLQALNPKARVVVLEKLGHAGFLVDKNAYRNIVVQKNILV